MQNALLAFVVDLCEHLELWYPKPRVEEAGYFARLAALPRLPSVARAMMESLASR